MKFLIAFFCLFSAVFADYRERARLALQNPDLYDGDMVGIDSFDRNIRPAKYFRWAKGVIPYVIDSSLSDHEDLIKQGFKHYQEKTCIRFIPRTDEINYIRIFSGKGCYSSVGKIRGEQFVSLGPDCLYIGTVVHELGHAVGFYHEQSRSDRDDYLEIHLENVIEGLEFNFRKLKPNQNRLVNEFDYNSIMIYGSKSFSKNDKDTMVAKNGQVLTDPYDKDGLSPSDIERVKKMYNC